MTHNEKLDPWARDFCESATSRLAVACALIVAVLVMCRPAMAATAPAGPRIALIIANFNYASDRDRLRGPMNDAATISKALEKLHFVGIDGSGPPTVAFDRSQKQMKELVVQFKKALEKAGPLAIGLFYYSGHGGADRAGRDNFLLPVDIPSIESADIEKQGVGVRSITNILQGIDAEKRPTIAVVIDACRTASPAGDSSVKGGRGAAKPGGLSMVMPDNQQPAGVIVVLSTGSGQTASDSGLYAETLAEKVGESGVSIVEMFEHVKIDVARKTGNAQIPVYQSQILVKTCLVSCADGAALASMKADLECSGLRPEDLQLAIRGENISRVKTVLRCKREYLLASEIRLALANLFRNTEYQRRQGLIGDLQAAGVHFVADLKPENPTLDQNYSPSPLRSVLAERNEEGLGWLLKNSQTDDLRDYPRLALIHLKTLPGLAEPERVKARGMLEQLIRKGLPVDANDHEAFRTAQRYWLETQFGPEQQPRTGGFHGRMWTQSFGSGRPREQAEYWRTVANLLAPPTREQRRVYALRASEEFAKPRVQSIEGIEKQLQQMLAGPGLRQIEDRRSPGGYRNVEVPPGSLREDDMIFDRNQLSSATSWASVAGVRDQIKQLTASKELLRRLAVSE